VAGSAQSIDRQKAVPCWSADWRIDLDQFTARARVQAYRFHAPKGNAMSAKRRNKLLGGAAGRRAHKTGARRLIAAWAGCAGLRSLRASLCLPF
jgi:hypothetical protein